METYIALLESFNQNTQTLFGTYAINIGEYYRVFPYFGEALAEPEYKEEKLISPHINRECI